MAQSASHILMVRPAAFGFDPQSARTNAFQHAAAHDPAPLALQEFDQAVQKLRSAGINVTVVQDSAHPAKPDAVFPNNWLSTWPDGQVFLYPMCAPKRRLERQPAVIDTLKDKFKVTAITDLSPEEHKGFYLESTGAIVFDHLNKTAYGNLSPRCHGSLFERHARQLGYQATLLHARDEQNLPIYHANVFMAIQTATAVVCGEALPAAERSALFTTLQKTGREVIDITFAQMRHFAANILELQNTSGHRYLVLSKNAFHALRPNQRRILAKDKTLLPIPVPTIETVGGGGIRCMITELFLPGRDHTSA